MTARHTVLFEKLLLVILAAATPAALSAAENIALTAPRVADKRVQGPTLVSMPALVYPEIARQARAAGMVRVTVLIGVDGQVLQAHAVSGPFVLRSFAEATIRNWRYKPAVLNKQPVEAATIVNLNFHL